MKWIVIIVIVILIAIMWDVEKVKKMLDASSNMAKDGIDKTIDTAKKAVDNLHEVLTDKASSLQPVDLNGTVKSGPTVNAPVQNTTTTIIPKTVSTQTIVAPVINKSPFVTKLTVTPEI